MAEKTSFDIENDIVGNPLKDIDQALHTFWRRIRLLNKILEDKKEPRIFNINNYKEKVMLILDDEHKKQYENTDENYIEDKYRILFNFLFNNIPANHKNMCEEVLTYKLTEFEKVYWEDYEKDIEPEYIALSIGKLADVERVYRPFF